MMERYELHTAAGFLWPKEATLYSLVELIFRDGNRPPAVGVLTGVAEAIQLDRKRLYTHEEVIAVDVLRQHKEVL